MAFFRHRLPLSALAVLFVAGCSQPPMLHVKSVPPPKLASGWDLAESEDKSVRIGVPSGWRAGVDSAASAMGLSEQGGGFNSGFEQQPPAAPGSQEEQVQQFAAQVDSMLETMNKNNEEASLEALRKKGVVVNVINPSIRPLPGEARTRFYVLKKKGDRPQTMVDAMEAELDHLPMGAKHKSVTLPIGKAERFEVTITKRDGGVLNEISYVFVDGRSRYAVRFVTQSDAGVIRGIENEVIQTLRVTPEKA